MLFHFKDGVGAAFVFGSYAPVAELVDVPDLGSGGLGRVGSSPIRRTRGSRRNVPPASLLLLISVSRVPSPSKM